MKILGLVGALGAAALGILSVAAVAGGVEASAQAKIAQPQLTILDTDIGDDIDDAFALALALRSPEIKLLGITTAYGDTDLRAQLLARFLYSNCLSYVPVIPGIPTPQDNVFTQATYAREGGGLGCKMGSAAWIEYKGLPGTDKERKDHDAAGFLLDQIRAHPGQITLIGIGPLNNIQAAIERDPVTFRKLKRAVLMAGSVYRGYDDKNGEKRTPDAEWNVNRDPAGLRALLASGVPVYMMPLDSTQIHLGTEEREKIFAHGSPLTDQLTLLYHQWVAGTDGHWEAPTLFDPVAVTYAIRPDLCPATPMRIEVDDKGFTRPVDGAPNAQVCLKSDEKGFLELLESRLTQDAGR
jgi:inosine-uridine nucleoside N-ribohydrolase